MLLSGRHFDSGKYRYGFNGQEKDDEIYGESNATTAQYWEYDARLGKRWNIDPWLKSWESPYATFSNSPILFSDHLGNKVDPASQGQWDAHKKTTTDRISSLEKEKTNLEGKKELNKRQQNRLDYINKSIGELEDAVKEMKVMEEDKEVTFHLTATVETDPELVKAGAQGITKREGNEVFIKYANGSGPLAHELKHGYQYLTGELDPGGFLRDVYDEQSSLIRGFAYSENYHFLKNYSEITTEYVLKSYEGRNVASISLNSESTIFAVLAFSKAAGPNMKTLRSGVNEYIDNVKSQLIQSGATPCEAIYKATMQVLHESTLSIFSFKKAQ
jgi:hypothetical protein